MISKHIFTSDVVSGKAFWLNNLQSTGNLVTANSNFTITNDATILGDLTVKGSTTTIDTVTLTVDDHNIELGSVDNPTDSTANGGGITLKGAGDKTFNWSSASNAWESNVGLNVLGGNVGIGTTSPSYELEIKDSSNDAYISVVSPNTDNAGILFGDTDASARGGIIYDNDDNSLAFRTNDNTDKMRIDSAGSVGIGTTNPDELLHIANTSGGASLLIETHNSSGGNVLFGDDTSNTVGRIQYLHSDNSMRLSTSDSNSPDMTIDSAGRVGIGTTSPGAKLEVNGDIANTTYSNAVYANSNQGLNGALTLRNKVESTGLAGNNVGLVFQNYSTGNSFGRISYIASVQEQDGLRYSNLVFGTDDGTGDRDEKMRITSAGNVGIGTTSPGAKLHVNTTSSGDEALRLQNAGGVERVRVELGSGTTKIIGDNSLLTIRSTDNDIAFNTNLNERMRIDLNGNVGIGTASPNSALHIEGGTNSTSQIRLKNYNNTDDISDFYITAIYNANQLQIRDGSGTSLMTVDGATGNVGIGTTSPSAKLTLPASESIHFDDTSGVTKAEINSGAAGTLQLQGDFDLRFKTTNEAMRIDSNGKVGIGTTSPVSPLHVFGQTNNLGGLMVAAAGTNIDSLRFWIDSSSTAHINRGGNQAISITNTRNVGIGTTDPDCKLDISTNNTTGLRLINHDSSGANASNDPPAILFQANGWDTNAGSRAYSARIRVNSNYSGAAGRGNTHPVMNFDLETNEDNPDDNLSTKMMINADGNVGIGTTSPGYKLHIVDSTNDGSGGIKVENYKPVIELSDSTTNATATTLTQDNSTFTIANNSVDSLTIDSAGNVGIGATSPQALLHVPQGASTIGGNDLTKASILVGGLTEGIGIDNNEITKKGTSDTGSLVIGNANANGEILLRTNLQNRLVISNSGASLTGGLTTSGNVSINANIDKVTDIYVQDQIIHHGDTDTYMQFHAADQWRVVAGGSEIIECTNTAFNVAKNTSMAGSLSVAGNLTVNGTTSTINSTTVTVDDKNIELGSVASPTNDTANGGGITLKGATDKTISWNKATTSWDISENLGVADGKYIFTDKVRARDAAGLLLQDDGGNGITINNGGNTSVSHALAVGGNTTIGGNTSIVGTTYLGGAATFNENVTINAAKTLQAGNITVANGKSISTDKIEARDSSGLSLVNDGGEGITISDTEGRVETTASLAVGESLAVAGAANLSSSLQVAGSTTFIGDINSFNNTTVNFGGNVNIGGETTFEGETVFQKNVVISGDFNVTSETPMTLEQGQLEIQTLTSAPQNTTNQLYNLNNNIYWNGTNLVTSHPNISAASSSNNSGRTYIQDITVDGNGHVTNIATATETVTNTNTTYSAGDHLNLNSTTFSVKRDLRGSNNGVSNGVYVIGQNFDDYFMVHGVTTNYADWYQGGDLRMRLQSPALTAGSADLHIEGDVLAFSTTVSDKNFKDNINTIDNALYKVNKLRGVEFEWNSTSRKGEKDIGVVAQEVEEVLPEIVREKTPCVGEFCENTEKYKTVDYQKLTAVLIEAVKELSTEVEDLKKKLS